MHAMPISRFLGRILFVNMSILFILLFNFSTASGYSEKIELNPEAYSIAELKKVVEDYESQVTVLDKQIKDVNKDLDWLRLKINRITDSGNKVPRKLTTSVIEKGKKNAVLLKQKSRLEKSIKSLEKIYSKQKSAENLHSVIKSKSNEIVADDTDSFQKMSDLTAAIKKAGLDDWVEIMNADNGCFKISNTLPILFQSGSASLAKEYQGFLKKLAGFLKPLDVKVIINGYADPDPIHTSKFPSNFELGASRAAIVGRQMVKYGLKPSIFKIGTTGEYHFAAKKQSREKSFRRRVQLTAIFKS
jgi:chemotaxis protein MotB